MFKKNKKINEINKIFFIKCCSFNSKYLKGKKFDLIVSNILLLTLKKTLKNFADTSLLGDI